MVVVKLHTVNYDIVCWCCDNFGCADGCVDKWPRHFFHMVFKPELRWQFNYDTVYFRDDADAMLFQLTWL